MKCIASDSFYHSNSIQYLHHCAHTRAEGSTDSIYQTPDTSSSDYGYGCIEKRKYNKYENLKSQCPTKRENMNHLSLKLEHIIGGVKLKRIQDIVHEYINQNVKIEKKNTHRCHRRLSCGIAYGVLYPFKSKIIGMPIDRCVQSIVMA